TKGLRRQASSLLRLVGDNSKILRPVKEVPYCGQLWGRPTKLGVRNRRKIFDFYVLESVRRQHEFGRFRVDWIAMGGIDVEGAGADHEIFAVRRFENRDAARFQNSSCLTEKVRQGLERQVLDNMKAGDRSLRTRAKGTQISDGISKLNFKSSFLA